jgi:hypothetical protein
MFLAPLSKIKWAYLCGFNPDPLFCPTRLHVCFVPVPCCFYCFCFVI